MVSIGIIERIGPLDSNEVMWSNPYEKEVKKDNGINADSVFDTFDGFG